MSGVSSPVSRVVCSLEGRDGGVIAALVVRWGGAILATIDCRQHYCWHR